MIIHAKHRSDPPNINSADVMEIAASRFCLLHSILFILALVRLGQRADASQTVHITNYNVSSLNGPSTYYQSMTLKNVADTIALPTHPSSLPLNTQKLATSDLTRDFNVQLKSIESNEMLIDTIQYAYNSLEQTLSDHNDTRAFNQIAGKIEVKLSTAMRIVSETNQRILGILSDAQRQSDRLFLDTIVLPSSPGWPLTKHSERRALDTNDVNVSIDSNSSTRYVGGSENGKSIEILNFLKNAGHLQQTNDKNFTINRRIIEILKEIDYSLLHVPNIRDAFFIPSHKFVGNDNCRNKVLCAHHRYLYASSVKWRNVIMVIDSGYTADDLHALDVVKAFGRQIRLLIFYVFNQMASFLMALFLFM